jgi:predicted RNA-binding Zn ribbon-like protein
MRKLIGIIVLLGFCSPVVAQTAMVFHNREVTLRLMQSPCSDANVRPKIQPDFQDQFRTAVVLWQGKRLTACWIALPESREVLIVDETGDNGTLPMSVFKREERL